MRLSVVFLILLIACASQVQKTEPFQLCNFPYIEWRAGECCLDLDANGVCDEHEAVHVAPEVIEEPVEDYSDIISTLLEDMLENYAFSSTDTGLVLVVGDKRRTLMEALSTGLTSVFWNTRTKEAFAVCDSDEEIKQRGKLFDDNTARCKVGMVTVKKLTPLEYQTVLAGTEGPIDWMKKYEGKVPFQVELGAQQLGARSINPVLQFRDPDGTMTVLRFDQYHKVPIRVERIMIKDGVLNKKIIDYDWYPEGVKNFPLIDATVTIPDKNVLEERGYDLVISQAYAVDEHKIRARGYFKNTGLIATPELDVKVECYDIAGNVLATSKVKIPALAPFNTHVFQLDLMGPSEDLEDCLAVIA